MKELRTKKQIIRMLGKESFLWMFALYGMEHWRNGTGNAGACYKVRILFPDSSHEKLFPLLRRHPQTRIAETKKKQKKVVARSFFLA